MNILVVKIVKFIKFIMLRIHMYLLASGHLMFPFKNGNGGHNLILLCDYFGNNDAFCLFFLFGWWQ